MKSRCVSFQNPCSQAAQCSLVTLQVVNQCPLGGHLAHFHGLPSSTFLCQKKLAKKKKNCFVGFKDLQELTHVALCQKQK